MSKITLLDSVEVKTPCAESWGEMSGNEQIRFCSHCAKDVHNLSAMTRQKARKIVARSNGGICIRYARRPDGRIQTVKNKLHQITRQTGIAAGVLGASLSLSTLAYAQTTENALPDSSLAQTVEVQNSDAPNGAISGTVTDPNGAVIPFAFVTLSCEQTNFYQTATANQDGFYEFKNVPSGAYKLKFEAGGFAALEVPEISVGAGAETTQNSQLPLQTVAEAVQVGGEELPKGTYMTMGVVSMNYRAYPENELVRAVERDYLDEVKLRVGMGARVNSKDKSTGNSPLHAAVENGNPEIAEFLLNHGAKINSRNSQKQTPLMMLDEDANADLVNLLIRHGAKVNLLDKEGDTALIFAAENASQEVIQTLISAGANVNAANKQGETALMKAAENGETEIVQLLLGSGANANARARDGETALSLTKNENAKQYLIAYGAH